MLNLDAALFTNLSLMLTLVLPPLYVAWRLESRHGMWIVVLHALVFGSLSQGLLGLIWNRMVMGYPGREAAAYVLMWGILSVLCVCWPNQWQKKPNLGAGVTWGVGLILAGAIAIRLIHPLGHAALGQSDAYSHLQFMQHVISDGMIHNQIYPPGFTWIMALPTLITGVDPYGLARFGGAFWGGALVLAMFALGRSSSGNGGGLLAAALVAFCPAWLPVIKTGVGVFANQLGLFLIPLFLWQYMRLGQKHSFWHLIAVSTVLAATVPMMWISLMPVWGFDRLFAPGKGRRVWWRKTILTLLALVPAGILLFWQSARMQGLHRDATLAIVTAGESSAHTAVSEKGSEPESIDMSPVERTPGEIEILIRNFFSVKRWGYGNYLLNAVGLCLAIVFMCIGLTGGIRHRNDMRLMGVWGMITSVQAGTGMMQFSGYQREGWSLLLATAWLSTLLMKVSFKWHGKESRRLGTVGLVGFSILCFIWMMTHPPVHPNSFSTAEGELVAAVRKLSSEENRNPDRLPLSIVARPFTGFHGYQGDVIAATLHNPKEQNRIVVQEGMEWEEWIRPSREYLFLMDTVPFDEGWSPGMFGAVQPDQVAQYLAAHRDLFRLNDQVMEWLDQLPREQWHIQQVVSKPNLTGKLVQPIQIPQSE